MKLLEVDMHLSSEEVLSIALDKQFLPRSYYEFYKAGFHVVEPSTPFVDNWVIRYLCDRLQKEVERIMRRQTRKKHLVINIPPRFGKSNIVTVFLNAWSWIHYPSLKFISVSYSGSLSEDHSIKTKELIDSTWYQMRFGDSFRMSVRKNTNKIFRNTMGGARVSTSVGGGITGKGGNIIILDDAIDPQKAVSDAERKKTNRWIGSSLSNRLNEPEIDMFVFVQQRVHEDDAVGHVVAKDPSKYEMIVVPAEHTYPITPDFLRQYYRDGLLDPVRFPRHVLQDLKISMGSQAYAGQFGQQPKAMEGNIFKQSWFQVISASQYQQRVGLYRPKVDFFLDTAYTDNERNDPTALGAFVWFGNTLYVLSVANKWMEFPELKKFAPQFCIDNGYDNRSIMEVEPKASGISVCQEIKRETGLNVVLGPAPKDSKTVRANSVTAFCEAGRVVLVDGSWVPGFLDQLTTFPNASHDDMADILVNAIRRYNKPIRTVS